MTGCFFICTFVVLYTIITYYPEIATAGISSNSELEEVESEFEDEGSGGRYHTVPPANKSEVEEDDLKHLRFAWRGGIHNAEPGILFYNLFFPFPEPLGHLTKRGRKQMYEMGKFLRDRYGKLWNDTYDPAVVFYWYDVNQKPIRLAIEKCDEPCTLDKFIKRSQPFICDNCAAECGIAPWEIPLETSARVAGALLTTCITLVIVFTISLSCCLWSKYQLLNLEEAKPLLFK